MPALAGRPLALQQWPQGIDKPGFYRQQMTGVPAWATQVRVAHDRRALEHLVVDRPETLLWLANQSALTLHMWSSRAEHLDEPDWVVIDLDPADEDRGPLITVARALKGLLDELNLLSLPKTSGKRGLHVLVPMARGHTHRDAVDFAVAVTRVLERGLPDLCTTERALHKRRGRLYLDAHQNGRGKTVVAPYSLRAVPGAPVSAPLEWREVTEALDPSDFTLRTMLKRLVRKGDLFAPALRGNQRLPRFRP